MVDLAPFSCTDVERSSFVRRVCYDKANQYMLISLNGVYYHYCAIDAATVASLMSADSVGSYYNATIKGRFDCRIGLIRGTLHWRSSTNIHGTPSMRYKFTPISGSGLGRQCKRDSAGTGGPSFCGTCFGQDIGARFTKLWTWTGTARRGDGFARTKCRPARDRSHRGTAVEGVAGRGALMAYLLVGI